MTAITLSPAERDPARIAFAVRQLTEGRTNANGTVTLSANVTTTTVSAPNCAATSGVLLFQKTANAAAIIASTYISSVIAGQFVITHPSDANTDKSFFWVALG